MKKVCSLLILAFVCLRLTAQRTSENLVIVTLDGMRWQEVFKGLDDSLANDSRYTRDRKELMDAYQGNSEEEKRKKLFPFLWNTIAAKGQLYGNRGYQNNIDNANPYWFSYPGYNEIFTGYPDTTINSNDKILNPNENVLEFLNKKVEFKGKIAAFTTWDVFPYILNEPRSGIMVNADIDTLTFNQPALKVLNDMQFLAPRPIGVRPDIITYMMAREYLKAYQPRVLYIAFDETDDFAHGGMYDEYLRSAHAQDAMIADIWNTLQSMPKYKDKTTLLITCDHGRGDKIKSEWKDHGTRISDAHQIWLAVMGPGVRSSGEMKQPLQLYQKQLAATIAAIVGFEFKCDHPVAPPIENLFRR